MSANELHTQFEQERQEMIAQKQIQGDMTAMRDTLWHINETNRRIEAMLAELLAWAKETSEDAA